MDVIKMMKTDAGLHHLRADLAIERFKLALATRQNAMYDGHR